MRISVDTNGRPVRLMDLFLDVVKKLKNEDELLRIWVPTTHKVHHVDKKIEGVKVFLREPDPGTGRIMLLPSHSGIYDMFFGRGLCFCSLLGSTCSQEEFEACKMHCGDFQKIFNAFIKKLQEEKYVFKLIEIERFPS